MASYINVLIVYTNLKNSFLKCDFFFNIFFHFYLAKVGLQPIYKKKKILYIVEN